MVRRYAVYSTAKWRIDREVCHGEYSTCNNKARKTLGQGVVIEVKRSWPVYVMLLPTVVCVIIFNYIPMIGLVMAFQNYKPWLGITKSAFIGWDNFRQIFEFSYSYQVIINTVIISVSKIVFGLIVPIFIALLLNEVRNTHCGVSINHGGCVSTFVSL